IAELEAMSAATIDRYLAPARRSMQLRGISTTKPSPLLRNSIGLSKVGDEPATVPGVIEADTVAHCGPTFQGEFARTLTMTDLVTGWTENASIRNNAAKWIVQAVADLQGMFPFPLRVFDSDNGSEFINHDVADWLQQRDIAQTRSRPYNLSWVKSLVPRCRGVDCVEDGLFVGAGLGRDGCGGAVDRDGR
ncbi:integrase catalytic domain-containing protein, partial [Tersicoccus phoenicis]|uniref:integrase catalytic domain-containing protein n=1 Tax=Tersicoccus phoenicis TaxID=554083 RepID=UPI001C456924